MKFWKNWPYWVRGGIIVAVVYAAVHFYLANTILSALEWNWNLYFAISFILYPLPTYFSLAFYFLLGTVMGFFYGKIKTRRTNSSVSGS